MHGTKSGSAYARVATYLLGHRLISAGLPGGQGTLRAIPANANEVWRTRPARIVVLDRVSAFPAWAGTRWAHHDLATR
jgi:hypothetical protein